ncbi:syntaxin-binding protein 5 [Leptopilina boulardi]|uniref:syntaxin-binding protein 5 n=1 Tax=Leptopilina boulardi TaxID=63433 RepID=UPI0021F554FD|nr:syntaxin-binding protein 5 [Leptopilina boulardi]XP_051157411.1 syntaxin-binding protein 5 [Leptopilina boulardi]XP_051157412.1 syntaxin-binding protein 5 [Leptopilina boulardi]
MKKFTFKSVLDNFRSSVAQQAKPEQEIVENLRAENFQLKKTFRHGFPYQPTALAFDPVQKLLAIGTKSGSLQILGRPGVDINVSHDNYAAVTQLQFIINEGSLISATADDALHLWSFRQKIPQIVQSLKFNSERITCMHLPLQSKWLYIGTERGNIYFLHVETFVISGYVINWNKAIEVTRKTHPGAVVHLSDHPLDLGKILIGYESGQVVSWDLKGKIAEFRCQTDKPLRSISWHHEGKQFMCSHTDGSLSTWTLRQAKPTNLTFPHAKVLKDGEPEPCRTIQKVEWKISKSSESFIVFTGGLPVETTGRTPSITVIQGKTTTVLEMEHNVVDFITLCESPWTTDCQEPYAVAVLLQSDFVVIDLLSPGFPCIENPYPMDIHESAVTCCAYFADCPPDLVPAFYSVGSKYQKRSGFSEKDWPICGGEWKPNSSSYSEIILTGHADGSIKFWDASAGTLQVLYKLKISKLFEKSKSRSIEGEEDPLAIQMIFLCPESRKLAAATVGRHVILFKFKKIESTSEVVILDISFEDKDLALESGVYMGSPVKETNPLLDDRAKDGEGPLRVKTGMQKRAPGFQASLICVTLGPDGEQTEYISALSLNSSYGLLSYGNESGLVVIDIVQKVSLLVVSTSDLGMSVDSSRILRSPKKQDERRDEDRIRSPSADTNQVNFTVFPENKTEADRFESSLQRSPSSSMSSLENISHETISCLIFADSYTKKDSIALPTLWIGTTLGSVQPIMFNMPTSGERLAQPVIIPTSKLGGTTFKLKGAILTMSFLDCNGALMPYSYDSWKDDNTESSRDRSKSRGNLANTRLPSFASPGFEDRQFVVIASEKQAKVIALPSQNCVYGQQLATTNIVVKAEITSLKDSVCLVCYVSNGHVTSYSLPSLRLLIDVDFLPLTNLRIVKTLCFSNRGHGLYLSSPSEIQEFTVSSDYCGEITDMTGDLFLTQEMPEQPKESFFKELFRGGSKSLDREELFGESSGRSSKSLVKHMVGPNASVENLRERASTATSDVAKAHQMVMERGEKLGELEERTARMMNEAEGFSQSAHGLMLKYKDRKWYQL